MVYVQETCESGHYATRVPYFLSDFHHCLQLQPQLALVIHAQILMATWNSIQEQQNSEMLKRASLLNGA
eukprot:2121340-Pyramimonas_sp.AAC.1